MTKRKIILLLFISVIIFIIYKSNDKSTDISKVTPDPFEHYINILDASVPAASAFRKFASEVKLARNESFKTTDSTISVKQLEKIDSLFLIFKSSSLKSVNDINRVKRFDDMPELKTAAINSLQYHLKYLNDKYSEIVMLMKRGLRTKNLEAFYSIMTGIKEGDTEELLFINSQKEFAEKYKFGNDKFEILKQRYSKFMIN